MIRGLAPGPSPTSPAPTRRDLSVDMWTLELPGRVDAASRARHAVRERYADVLTEEELLRAVMLVSELIAASVLRTDGPITMHTHLDSRRLRVDAAYRRRAPEYDAAVGTEDPSADWGLTIITMLASRWGPETDALAWFELDRPPTVVG